MALPQRKVMGICASVIGPLIPLAMLAHDFMPLLFTFSVMVLLFGIICLFRIREIRSSATETAFVFMGFLYVPLLLGHLALLREMRHGMEWVLLLLFIVMAGDTTAYYVGSNLGRKRLYPVVSPNKSVEGAIGGLAGSMAASFIARATYFPELTIFDCTASAILFGVMGQIGDLFESLLKRSFGVKDSGRMMPGHGGILDRLDSILFAAPAAFYYAYYIFPRW